MTGTEGLAVVHLPDLQRFEVRLAGTAIGLADYLPVGSGVASGPGSGDTWAVTHTETDPAHRGRGVAAFLLAGLVATAREHGRTVRPLCPYVAHWFRRNPQAADVLAGQARA